MSKTAEIILTIILGAIILAFLGGIGAVALLVILALLVLVLVEDFLRSFPLVVIATIAIYYLFF